MVGSPRDTGGKDTDNESVDDGNCEDPIVSPSGDCPTKSRVRGARLVSRVRKLSCDGEKKISVKCNAKGKGTCRNSSLMESYLGYLARRFVSIAYERWPAVPMQIKNDIYNTIQKYFDIPERMTRKLILKSAGNKWRNFKTFLGKLIYDKKENQIRAEPPEEYQYIDLDAWKEFVQKRVTKEFQDKSRANTERAKQNKYPYRYASMGYARLECELLTQQQLDPDMSAVDRHELWKVARRDSNGEYCDAETARMARKIDLCVEQESQGIIKLHRGQDILSVAFEKDDHPGRVRGAGFGVTKKGYFGVTKPRSATSQQEVTLLRDEVAELRKIVSELQKANVTEPHKAAVTEPQKVVVTEAQKAAVTEAQKAGVTEAQKAVVTEAQKAAVIEAQKAAVTEPHSRKTAAVTVANSSKKAL